MRGIDMNLQDYGGAQDFKGSLRGLSHHLADPGPVAAFLQGDYSTSEVQAEQLQTLRAALETGRSSLIDPWGQYWYETVVEMVEVERDPHDPWASSLASAAGATMARASGQ